MYEDSRGVFWVGTSGDGLHTMDRTTGRFERHFYNPEIPDQLSRPPLKPGDYHDKITFITGDSTGAIWIGSFSSGINRYDTGTKKITHYILGNGFPDSTSWNTFTSRDGVGWRPQSKRTARHALWRTSTTCEKSTSSGLAVGRRRVTTSTRGREHESVRPAAGNRNITRRGAPRTIKTDKSPF